MTAPPAWDDVTVARRLTVQRLTSYLAATDGDVPRALALYDWNTAAAGALFATGGRAEVVVRNALDEQLSRWSVLRHGTARWFSHAPLADEIAAVVPAPRSCHHPRTPRLPDR